MITAGLHTVALQVIDLQGRYHSFKILCWFVGWTGWTGHVGISNIETSSPSDQPVTQVEL